MTRVTPHKDIHHNKGDIHHNKGVIHHNRDIHHNRGVIPHNREVEMTGMTSLTKGCLHTLHMLLQEDIILMDSPHTGHILLNMVTPHKDIPNNMGAIHHKDILLLAHTRQLVTPVLLHITQGMDLVEWGLC